MLQPKPVPDALRDHAALNIMQSRCAFEVVSASHLYLSTSKCAGADGSAHCMNKADSAPAPCTRAIHHCYLQASLLLTLQRMRWQEAAEGMVATIAEAQPGGAPAASPAGDDFAPAAAFAGARPGFAFQAGPLGLGYYREGSAAQRGSGLGAGVGSDTAAERAAGTAEVCTQCFSCCLPEMAACQALGCLFGTASQEERGDCCGQHRPCLTGCYGTAAGTLRGVQLKCTLPA